MKFPTGTAGRKPVAALAVTAALAVVVGATVYLVAPFGKLDSERPDNMPSGDQIVSARESLSSASMMFTLMSSALTSASGSISTVTSGAKDIFDAIDTATEASSSLVGGFDSAPDASAAAAQANQGINAIGSALVQAQGLSGVAKQLDSLVTPLVTALEANPTPGGKDALTELKNLQTASRTIEEQLGSLSELNAELKDVEASLNAASGNIDQAVAQASVSAKELNTGLTQLSSARADSLKGAAQITEGVDRLSGVMESIQNDISSAQQNLEPAGGYVEELPAEPLGPADRLPWALLFGAATVLIAFGARMVLARRSAKARTRTGESASGAEREMIAPDDLITDDLDRDTGADGDERGQPVGASSGRHAIRS